MKPGQWLIIIIWALCALVSLYLIRTRILIRPGHQNKPQLTSSINLA